MLTVPPQTGLCPERWKTEIDGGRKIKQAADHPTAGGGPQPRTTHSFRQEHSKTGKESQGNHQ
jgi:hypothetical protein